MLFECFFGAVARAGAQASRQIRCACGYWVGLLLWREYLGCEDVISTRDYYYFVVKDFRKLCAAYDATRRGTVGNAGAVILGKTNCDEFCDGNSNENSLMAR